MAGEVLGRRRWLDTLIRPSECLGATDYLELVLAALKLGSQRTGRSSGVPVVGEADSAFAMLESARWDIPTLIGLRADPLLEDFRQDPRYARTLERVGLKP